jgi:hypothetical protein
LLGQVRGQKFVNDINGLPISGIFQVEQPYWCQHGRNLSPSEFGIKDASGMENFTSHQTADLVQTSSGARTSF